MFGRIKNINPIREINIKNIENDFLLNFLFSDFFEYLDFFLFLFEFVFAIFTSHRLYNKGENK